MTKEGRPRKPTRLKLLQGTARPDRANKEEPKLPTIIPRAAKGLSDQDGKAWRHIARILRPMNIMTAADVLALELLATAYVDFWEARRTINEKGPTYVSKTEKMTNEKGSQVLCVIIRRRPEIEIMSDAWRRIEKMLSHFGLSPSSRSRVSVIRKLKEADPFDQF